MVSTAQQGVGAIQSIGTSLGSSNPFAPLMGSVNGLGQGLNILSQNSVTTAQNARNLAEAEDRLRQALADVNQEAGPTEQQLQKIADAENKVQQASENAQGGLAKLGNIGSTMMGIGVGIAGVSAGIQQLAGPIQQSENSLQQVVKNSSDVLASHQESVQGTISLYQSAGEAAARYGFNLSQTNDSLSRLTAITGDSKESVKELNLAEIITTQTHGSLAQATQMLGQAHGGMYRQFRQFGLDLPNVNASLADTTKATEAVTLADQKLSAAQKNLTDYNEQLTEKLQAQKDAWAQKVQSADATAQDAEASYTQALETYNQKKSTDEANWAEAVQNANDAVATAEQNLNDLQSRIAAEEADRAAQRQEQIENQNQSLEDATTRRQQLLQRQAIAGPARTASEELSRQQALADATQAVQKEQEKLNDLQTKPLDTNAQALDQKEQIRKATDAVATAQDKANDAVLKQQQGEAALAIQYQSVLKAQDAMLDAQNRDAQVRAKAAAAGQATSAELEKQRHLQEAVTKATEEDQKAKDNLTKAQEEQNKLQQNFNTIEDFLSKKYGGVLEARRHSFQGFLDNMKADITNWVGTEGPQLAEIGLLLGTSLSAGGGIINMIKGGLGGISGIIKKAKGDSEGPMSELGGLLKSPGPAMEEGAAGVTEGSSGFIASIGSMVAGAAPILGIVAVIALVAYAGYDIVKHWGIISKDLAAGWGRIEGFAKQIWGDIVGFFKGLWNDIVGIFTGIFNFFKEWGPKVLEVLTGAWMVIEIVKHWHDIKDGIFKVFDGAIKFLENVGKDILNGLKNGFLWVWDHVVKPYILDFPKNFVKLFDNAIHWLEDAGKDVLHGLANGILRAAEDTIGHVPLIGGQIIGALKDALGVKSPSTITHQIGVDFMTGLLNGINASHPAVLDKLQQVGQQAAQRTLQGLGTPTIGVGTAGLGLPGYTTPGALPISGGGGGSVTNVFQIKFDVNGNIVTEQNFFQQFRNWLIQQGLHSGGNYTGAGSSTV